MGVFVLLSKTFIVSCFNRMIKTGCLLFVFWGLFFFFCLSRNSMLKILRFLFSGHVPEILLNLLQTE